jgi:N-acetyltransferase 10
MLACAAYACRCIELLKAYYQNKLSGLEEGNSEDDAEHVLEAAAAQQRSKTGNSKAEADVSKTGGDKAEGGQEKEEQGGEGKLLTEHIAPRSGLPPLLVPLSDRPPERLHYLGA